MRQVTWILQYNTSPIGSPSVPGHSISYKIACPLSNDADQPVKMKADLSLRWATSSLVRNDLPCFFLSEILQTVVTPICGQWELPLVWWMFLIILPKYLLAAPFWIIMQQTVQFIFTESGRVVLTLSTLWANQQSPNWWYIPDNRVWHLMCIAYYNIIWETGWNVKLKPAEKWRTIYRNVTNGIVTHRAKRYYPPDRMRLMLYAGNFVPRRLKETMEHKPL